MVQAKRQVTELLKCKVPTDKGPEKRKQRAWEGGLGEQEWHPGGMHWSRALTDEKGKHTAVIWNWYFRASRRLSQ